MPYKVKKEGDKYVVYKKDTGKRVGSTAGNKEALKKYMAALHLNAKESVKEDAKQDVTNLITKVKNYNDFVAQLGDLAKDPKVQAFIKSGKADGDQSDDQLKAVPKQIPVVDLRPTQNEIDVQGSLRWPLTRAESLVNCLKKGPVTIKAPVVTYNGQWIIDGHHRWSQLYSMNKDGIINCVDLVGPKMNPIDVLKIVQLAIAADLGKVPTAAVKGQNLLKLKAADIVKYTVSTITDECVKIFNKMRGGAMGKLEPNTIAGKIVVPNVMEMQKTGIPAAGAPKRDVMPQTDDATNAMPMISKGVINYKEPYALQELRKHLRKAILKELKK
jgi:hypothetical protein